MRLRTAAPERDDFEPNFAIHFHSPLACLLRDLRATSHPGSRHARYPR
jgi:hypothetical protein